MKSLILAGFLYFSVSVLAQNAPKVFLDTTKNSYGFRVNDEIIITPQFEFAGDFHENYAPVKYEGKYGLINTDGTWFIRPEYELISFVSKDHYITYKDSVFKVVTLKGETVFSDDKLNFSVEGYKAFLTANETHPDRRLILRVIEMTDLNRCGPDNHIYVTLSKSIMEDYEATKWFVENGDY